MYSGRLSGYTAHS